MATACAMYVCDACDRPITGGTRYRSLDIADFDLCQGCWEANNLSYSCHVQDWTSDAYDKAATVINFKTNPNIASVRDCADGGSGNLKQTEGQPASSGAEEEISSSLVFIRSGQELLDLNRQLQEESLLELASVGGASSFESVALSENAPSEVVIDKDVDPIKAFMEAEADNTIREFELLDQSSQSSSSRKSGTSSGASEGGRPPKDFVVLPSDIESVVSRTQEVSLSVMSKAEESVVSSSSVRRPLPPPIETEYLGCKLSGPALSPPCTETVEELKKQVEGVPSPSSDGHCILLGKLENEEDASDNVIKAYIRNNGESAWPDDLCLRLVHGSGLGGHHLPLAGLLPGEVAEIVLPIANRGEGQQLGSCCKDQFSIFCLTQDQWVVGKDMFAIAY